MVPVLRRLIPAHAGKTRTSGARSSSHWAHPRSRGENISGTLWPGLQNGSSPLTRGKRRHPEIRRHPQGLIPAHAGKTRPQAFEGQADGAHPRSRGENRGRSSGRASMRGSSPLTRGKLDRGGLDLGRDRLIPAHAGKTKPAPSTRAPVKAHPRSRGENWVFSQECECFLGSSPLTRGKLKMFAHYVLDGGLIPAHAGKTLVAQL